MIGTLIEQIGRTAAANRLAQDCAQEALDRFVEAQHDMIKGLVDAATLIDSREGATLAGHKFYYLPPAEHPVHTPLNNVFFARVFEAWFEGSPVEHNNFGLSILIDEHYQPTPQFSGAAKAPNPESRRTIADQFASWLRDMRLRYSALPPR